MLSLLFYMCWGFITGFLTRSPAIPAVVYILYHFCFWRPILGTGFLSEIEFDVFYSLAFMMHAILGWVLALILAVPTSFVGTKHCPIPCTREPAVCKPKSSRRWIVAYIYRFAMSIITIFLMAAATLPFELIPLWLSWLSIILTVLAILIVHIFFLLMFWTRIPPKKIMDFKAVYIHGNNSCHECPPHDMAPDVVIYLAIYYIPMILAFCLTFILAPWWWQFWTAFIIFGFYMIFYIIARFAWLHPRGPGNRGYKGTERECNTRCQH